MKDSLLSRALCYRNQSLPTVEEEICKALLNVGVIPQDHYDHMQKVSFVRALDKRKYLVIIRDNFCEFCLKTNVVTPHLNRVNKTVQMKGHNIWFR